MAAISHAANDTNDVSRGAGMVSVLFAPGHLGFLGS